MEKLRPTLAGAALLLISACLGDVEVPPEPPTVTRIESPTAAASQAIAGQKEKGTSVLRDGEVVVPHDDEESWMLTVDLVPGDNTFELTSTRPSGLASRESTSVSIVFEPPCPQAPIVDSYEPTTRMRSVSLTGTRPAATALVLDGNEIIPLGNEQDWTHTLMLPDQDGAYDLTFVARDSKDRDSDPAVVTIVLDRAAPAIVARYPAVDDTGIPTNALISVTFDGSLVFLGGNPPVESVTVRANGQPAAGIVTYAVQANTVEWFSSTGALAPDTTYEVTMDATMFTDVAGNAGDPAAPFGWSWTFTTTTGPDMTPPPAPTLDAIPATTPDALITLQGTKGANASVLLNGRKIVGINPDTTWTYDLALPVGTSSITLASRSAGDIETASPATSQIERVQTKPAPPTVDDGVPMSVAMPSVNLLGGRPADTSILLNDLPVVCRAPETTWAFAASLSPGVNDLRLQSRDANGNVSDPLLYTVSYEQAYDGPVPADFTLRVSFNLRDLSQIPGVREEFATGANNYGIDVWLEGPVGLEETCEITNGVRQNIKYVATLEHYIGQKAQHKVPFADEDYRGTDYLASLITGGVFKFRGLDATSQRRELDGRELDGLLAGLTEEDLRQNIDCFGSPIIDACTRATANAGRYETRPWTPRKREATGLLAQGDYLLFIMINLDRSGSWLSANDLETCWGDPAFDNVGMHRVVTRIALGSEAYELEIPRTNEQSGADREGADKLFFLSNDGVRITWGPSN